MALCFGKGAVDGNEPEAKPRRKYSLKNFKSSMLSIRQELEWKVGGRYKVQRSAAIFTTEDLKVSSGLLEIENEVLLLTVELKGFKEIGHVLHKGPTVEESQCPGWIVLQDQGEEQPTLLRRRLEDSWDIGGRYRVNTAATVRAKASLSSDIIREVLPAEEVIVEALSVEQDEERRFHLRALVSSTNSGLTGWVSPETLSGNTLLDPVKIMGKEDIVAQRPTMASGSTTRSSKGLSARSSSTRSTRSSLHSILGWRLGGSKKQHPGEGPRAVPEPSQKPRRPARCENPGL